MINIRNPNRMQHKSKKICSEERKKYITDIKKKSLKPNFSMSILQT